MTGPVTGATSAVVTDASHGRPDDDLPNLASERGGATVVACTDEFFGAAVRLLHDTAPVARPHTYDEHGQWMDGWETRRHRAPDTDWVVVRLGAPGVVRTVVVDTAFFSGNQPELASLDGCYLPGNPGPDEVAAADWLPLLPPSPLGPDAQHRLTVTVDVAVTHVRLRMHPDGGIARLRVHGEVRVDPRALDGLSLDLAAAQLGGVVEQCSDMHFGDRRNLVAPGEARSMGEGWETRRRRGEGADWAVVRLAAEGVVRRVSIDTRHFRGNAPGSCDVEVSADRAQWTGVLTGIALQPDQVHLLPVPAAPAARWLRLTVHPDGGVARLRADGHLSRDGRRQLALQWLRSLPVQQAEQVLTSLCGSARWAATMARGPFDDAMHHTARAVWDGLEESDWEQALAAHPRIGDRPDAGSQERREQAGAEHADPAVLAQIRAGNVAYEQRFGRTYVVRATGRSAQELLDVLHARLQNAPDVELREAAAQQAEITDLRLSVLLDGPP